MTWLLQNDTVLIDLLAVATPAWVLVIAASIVIYSIRRYLHSRPKKKSVNAKESSDLK